ncbi:MAG: VOC family protein [Gammaproteobacteria bacterium]
MLVLDHVSITVSDLNLARPFYDAIMAALGVPKVYDELDAIGYGARCDAAIDAHSYFSVLRSPTAHTDQRRHWCFKASSRAQVDAFHRAGLACGGFNGGVPGLRSHYHPHYYAAFLIDPGGNRIEAVCHRPD